MKPTGAWFETLAIAVGKIVIVIFKIAVVCLAAYGAFKLGVGT